MAFKRSRLWSASKRWYSLGIPLGGYLAAVVGVLLWGGFSTALELTNTESFCISCHEMRDTVYQEYRLSPHFNTASGVGATCPDCHVPKALLPKLVAKVKASADVYHTLMGTIDTPEKFNARRALMAERVWDIMKTTDSRECRSCHSQERMDLTLQDRQAAKKHKAERMASRGETCIDCHKGIAHKLPD